MSTTLSLMTPPALRATSPASLGRQRRYRMSYWWKMPANWYGFCAIPLLSDEA
jgi:hypothetical protein